MSLRGVYLPALDQGWRIIGPQAEGLVEIGLALDELALVGVEAPTRSIRTRLVGLARLGQVEALLCQSSIAHGGCGAPQLNIPGGPAWVGGDSLLELLQRALDIAHLLEDLPARD